MHIHKGTTKVVCIIKVTFLKLMHKQKHGWVCMYVRVYLPTGSNENPLLFSTAKYLNIKPLQYNIITSISILYVLHYSEPCIIIIKSRHAVI